MTEKKYSGNTGTPIQIKYPRASAQRQTEEGRYRQPTRKQPVTTDDENPDAWTVEKTPNSAVRLDRLPRKTGNHTRYHDTSRNYREHSQLRYKRNSF